MPKRARIFIGSSSEGLKVAQAIQRNLDYLAETKIWTQGVFGLTSGVLDTLLRTARNCDFAILVLTPDDVVTKREETTASPRDNVIFELGIFMGALGRDRCFIVHERQTDMSIPSDLAGVITATYHRPKDDDYVSAVGAACTDVSRAIASIENANLGKAELLVGTWDMTVTRIAPTREDVPDKTLDVTFTLDQGSLVGHFIDGKPDAPFERRLTCEFFPGNFLVMRSEPANPAIEVLGYMVVKGNNICTEFRGRIVGIAAWYGDIFTEEVTLANRRNIESK